MASSEVQRTLVKSPPELWAEISDPAALARHFDAFGAIRITRVEPEQRVDWQADSASGSVLIKPSGWGTKVKLTVTRESGDAGAGSGSGSDEPAAFDAIPALRVARAPHPPPSAAEPAPELGRELEPGESADLASIAGAEPALAPEPQLTIAPEPQPAIAPEPQPAIAPEPQPAIAPEPQPAIAPEPDAEPRRSFFARLLGWRGRAQAIEPVIELGDAEALTSAVAADRLVVAPPAESGDASDPRERSAEIEPPPAPKDVAPEQAPPGDATAGGATAGGATAGGATDADGATEEPREDATAADGTADEVTATLTSVLDRLGAAHHRPFSRS
jgi:outer membrane biosynthesis protein TonB